MSTKTENLNDPSSCLSKAADDEEIFILRSKDPLFVEVVEYWAMLAKYRGVHEDAKIHNAQQIAHKVAMQWKNNA